MSKPELDFTPYFALGGKQAFKSRQATMPWRSATPIAKDQIANTWQNLLSQATPPRKRLLYLHIPFCSTHCTFCGFYQNYYREELGVNYVQLLLRELEMEAGSVLYQSAPIHAVYFGGGTPSALLARDLARIITAIRTRLPLAPDCEITIEGRINQFDDERIDACLDAGANRFSIGVQSFNSQIRKKMARLNDGPSAIAFMKKLCRRDRATVVCDLLFGLAGQDEKLWAQDLEIAQDLGLDGVDLYALNLLPGTALAKSVAKGTVDIPTPAQCRDLYLQACHFMAQIGWHCISNSHWASNTRERNLYNLLIKRGADYLTLGSGAGGSLGAYSWMTEPNLNAWQESIAAGKKPLLAMTHSQDSSYQWRHELRAGVETGRVPLEKITDKAYLLQPLIDQWHGANILQDRSSCLRLTNEGRFWSSNITHALQELIAKINTTQTAPQKVAEITYE